MVIFKEINIKNCLYYFLLNDVINIKNFEPNILSMDKTSFKSSDSVIYNINYISHVNIDNEYLSCLIFDNVDGYIEESNGEKYSVFASTRTKKY